MKMKNEFTAIYERHGDWYIAYVEEIPGANTQGRTLKEAKENLKEAVAMMLQYRREQAERGLKGKRVFKKPLLVSA